MRRLLALLITLPLAVGTSLLAHQASYFLAAPEDHEALLADTGHGYLNHFPMLFGLVVALGVVGLLVEFARTLSLDTSPHRLAWPFALVAPLGFVLQEHVERLVHESAVPWGTALEPTFELGLVLQLPAAIAAWWIARLLLRAAQTAALAIVRASPIVRRPRDNPWAPVLCPFTLGHACGPELLSAAAGRAPPTS